MATKHVAAFTPKQLFVGVIALIIGLYLGMMLNADGKLGQNYLGLGYATYFYGSPGDSREIDPSPWEPDPGCVLWAFADGVAVPVSCE